MQLREMGEFSIISSFFYVFRSISNAKKRGGGEYKKKMIFYFRRIAFAPIDIFH
jgi:hypothetical protein